MIRKEVRPGMQRLAGDLIWPADPDGPCWHELEVFMEASWYRAENLCRVLYRHPAPPVQRRPVMIGSWSRRRWGRAAEWSWRAAREFDAACGLALSSSDALDQPQRMWAVSECFDTGFASAEQTTLDRGEAHYDIFG